MRSQVGAHITRARIGLLNNLETTRCASTLKEVYDVCLQNTILEVVWILWLIRM